MVAFRSRRPPRPPAAADPATPPTPLAFAGAGTMSAIHALAAAAAGLPVVAVASRSAERAQERAEQIGARPCAYRDLPAGAAAVVVMTPPAAHVALALDAIAAGAAVLVETPLAATLADADELVAAEQAGAVVLYGENLASSTTVAAAVVATRRLGPLGYLEVRALSPRPTLGGAGHREWGGGVLLDLGVHPIALAMLLAGGDRPTEVTALLSAGADPTVDDHAEVRLRFASGLEARIEASWRHHDTVWDLQASSATGVVRADLLPTIALEHDGEPVAVPRPQAPDGLDPKVLDLGYVAQLRAVADAAVDGRRPPTALGAAFGRAVLDVVFGAYESAGAGGPVELPFAGPRDRPPVELWRP